MTVKQRPEYSFRPFNLTTEVSSKKIKSLLLVYTSEGRARIHCDRMAKRMRGWIEMKYGSYSGSYKHLGEMSVDDFIDMVKEFEQMHEYIYSKAKIK